MVESDDNERIYKEQYLGIGKCSKCKKPIKSTEPYIKVSKIHMNDSEGKFEGDLFHDNGVCNVGQ